MEGIEGEEPLTLLSFLSPKYVSKGQRALLMRLFQWGEKRVRISQGEFLSLSLELPKQHSLVYDFSIKFKAGFSFDREKAFRPLHDDFMHRNRPVPFGNGLKRKPYVKYSIA